MNVCQLYIWTYWRCVEKQLSWWCFYLEISCHRLENSCRETVELVMLLPWNLLPPPWKSLLRNSWVGDAFTLKSPAIALNILVEKQLSWWSFYLEISCHRLENPCRETVELVMLLPWNLLPPLWKFLSRNSWVGDAFTLESPATALKILVFPATAPILLGLIASIIRSDLFLPSALTLFLLKRRARLKGLLTIVKL